MVIPWQFHFTADALCLDFANTLSWRRSRAPVERLGTYSDLASWMRQAALISKKEEIRLRQAAAAHPARSHRTLARARSLREAIFAVFAAISERHAPADGHLRVLERWIQQAVGHSQLVGRDGSYRWEPVVEPDSMQRLLWTIALSAGELLTTQGSAPIGQCFGRDCRWLWIDRTRNRSRRWCDMAVCGNRAKARRHYERSARAHAG